MAVLDIHEQTLRRSIQIAKASEFLFPKWRLYSPYEVMRLLERAGIRFVLVGSFGLCGWRKQARAAGFSEVIVGRSVWRKAVAAMSQAIPKALTSDLLDYVELRQPAMGEAAVRIVKPLCHPYVDVLKNAEAVRGKYGNYRIPNLEMSLTLMFAEMTGEDRSWADRYQAAHDFICILQANERIDEKKVRRLTSLVSPNSAKDVFVRIERIRHGERIGDLTLGS